MICVHEACGHGSIYPHGTESRGTGSWPSVALPSPSVPAPPCHSCSPSLAVPSVHGWARQVEDIQFLPTVPTASLLDGSTSEPGTGSSGWLKRAPLTVAAGGVPAVPRQQVSACLPLGRCLHAHWHRAAAVDGLGGHGGLLRVCGAVVSAAQVVSPGQERLPESLPRPLPPLRSLPG